MSPDEKTGVSRVVLAITGASGAPYGRALLRELLRVPQRPEVHLIVSDSAVIVMKEELGLEFPRSKFAPAHFLGSSLSAEETRRIVQHNNADIAAPPASGTWRHSGMVICPCSMKTLGSIAHGTGSNLVGRAADACLKERRRLVLVPRETPLNLIHLRNMVTVTEAGAVVLPAMPGFYHRPASIDELVQHVVLKILDSLGLERASAMRWKDSGE